jgi:hypothetical protein
MVLMGRQSTYCEVELSTKALWQKKAYADDLKALLAELLSFLREMVAYTAFRGAV